MASGYNGYIPMRTESMSGRESEELFSGLTEVLASDSKVAEPEENKSANITTVNRHLFSGSKNSGDRLGDVANHSTTNSDTQLLILQEVKKANSCLDAFSDHLEAVESRLASVENNQLSSATPSSSTKSSGRGKRKVPAKVRHEVREVYKAPFDDDITFWGFDTKKRFTDVENQQVVKTLIGEVNTLDSKISLIQVRDAARRFFQPKCEEETLKGKGKYELKVTQQRHRNRLILKQTNEKIGISKSSDAKDNFIDRCPARFMEEGCHQGVHVERGKWGRGECHWREATSDADKRVAMEGV